jgi:RNA polymerase sigma-70 factor, ECF subfamily
MHKVTAVVRLNIGDPNYHLLRKSVALPSERRDLEPLYCECRQQLFTCALAITDSPARAEDAVHDAFCRLLRNRTSNEGSAPGDLRAYAFRAVRNAAIDQVRRMGAAPEPLPKFVFDPAPNPAASVEDREFLGQVVALIERLAPDERETIVQHLYGGLTFQEIATVRDVPPGTIVSWYRRGVEKLRRTLLEVADRPV